MPDEQPPLSPPLSAPERSPRQRLQLRLGRLAAEILATVEEVQVLYRELVEELPSEADQDRQLARDRPEWLLAFSADLGCLVLDRLLPAFAGLQELASRAPGEAKGQGPDVDRLWAALRPDRGAPEGP